MYFLKNHKTSLEAEEMQLIRPTSEFKVGHLPFQGKVKGILPRWGRSKPSGSMRITFINCDVLSPDFQGRRPVLTLLREEKVAAEPTDELYFLKASALVVRFLSSNARFKGVNLAPGGEGGKFLLFKNFSDEM